MAQRAYRQRKESLIDDLRHRVSDLTRTAELMHQTWLDYHNRLPIGSLPDTQLRVLRDATSRFDKLKATIRDHDDDSMSPPRSPSPRPQLDLFGSRDLRGPRTDLSIVRSTTEIRNVPSWLDQAAVSEVQQKKSSPLDLGMGYTAYPSGLDFELPDLGYVTPQSQTAASISSAPGTLPKLSPNNLISMMSNAVQVSQELRVPVTYSFQEKTFGRYLHRACLEHAYHILFDPRHSPEVVERKFKLTMLHRERDILVGRFKALLERGSTESLDSGAPYIAIGGAGTHYPKRDQFGNKRAKKEPYNLGTFDAQTLPLLEGIRNSIDDIDMSIEIQGYEGVWFDPYDVEGWLEERGLRIDSTSSFAETEFVEWTSMQDANSEPEVVEITLPQDSGERDMQDQSTLAEEPFKWDDISDMNFTGVGYSDALTGGWNFLDQGQSISTITPVHGSIESPAWAQNVTEQLASTMSIPVRATKNKAVVSRPGLQPRRKKLVLDVAAFLKGEQYTLPNQRRANICCSASVLWGVPGQDTGLPQA